MFLPYTVILQVYSLLWFIKVEPTLHMGELKPTSEYNTDSEFLENINF